MTEQLPTRQLRVSLSASGEIALTIPSPLEARSHTVEVPCTVEGLRLLKSTLQEHSRAHSAQLASAARPTQYDINAMLREFKPQVKEPSASSVAKEIDLDALDLSSLKF